MVRQSLLVLADITDDPIHERTRRERIIILVHGCCLMSQTLRGERRVAGEGVEESFD